MSKEYFLKTKWTVKEVTSSDGQSPRALDGIKAGTEVKFSESGGRIVGKPEKIDQDVKELWKTLSFVHEPVHDRLLGILVHDNDVHILEITQWNDEDYPGDWIQCGYVPYKHIPHPLHEGWWHGDGTP